MRKKKSYTVNREIQINEDTILEVGDKFEVLTESSYNLLDKMDRMDREDVRKVLERTITNLMDNQVSEEEIYDGFEYLVQRFVSLYTDSN